MNGKRAKGLRSIAREVTIGQPEARYRRNSSSGVITLHPQCTRAVYKALKRRAKGQEL